MKKADGQEMEELTLEEAYGKLEEILTNLESSEITLEDSFKEYAHGMELLKACNEKIDLVEKKVKLINEEGELSDF